MDKEPSSTATGDAEEHSQPSRSEMILKMMQTEDDQSPEEVVKPTAEEVAPPEKDEEVETPDKDSEEESEETEAEEEAETEEKPEAKKGQEWPDSAKARVAEETAKRKERTIERDKAIARAQKAEEENLALKEQLQGATRPVPTPQNPYSDVYDETSIRKAEREAEKIIEFCETHREGAYDIAVGKNEDGTPKKEDFTPEQITKMKLTAERALRRDIPERRQYLSERARMDAAAVEAYPDYKDENSELVKFAGQTLRNIPQLEQLIGPEVLAWIGHAYRGREVFLEEQKGKGKNGNGSVRKILESKETKLAPSRIKQRGDVKESGQVNVAPAIKKMQESGSDEDMEDAIGAIRSAHSRRA